MSTIDAAKYHEGLGPGTVESSCWHIVTFLLWCADHGLLGARLSADDLRRDPTDYFVRRCAGKLWPEDLTAEGAEFAERIWKDYSHELADLSLTHDIPTVYDFCVQPNAEEIRGWCFEYFDEEFGLDDDEDDDGD